jgi:fatty-acid desaturase
MGTLSLVLASLALLTSLACMVLLFRGYAASGVRLLLWSALCFVFLTLNNAFLVADLAIVDIDLRPYRLVTALLGIAFLLYGFIREAE